MDWLRGIALQLRSSSTASRSADAISAPGRAIAVGAAAVDFNTHRAAERVAQHRRHARSAGGHYIIPSSMLLFARASHHRVVALEMSKRSSLARHDFCQVFQSSSVLLGE